MFARPIASVTRGSSFGALLLAALLSASLGSVGCSANTGTSGGTTVTCLPTNPLCNKTDAKIDSLGGADAGGGGATDDSTGGGTDDDATGGGGGGGTDDGPPANFTGYSAKELLVRIVGPSGRGQAVVSGKNVVVNGVVFGKADTITYEANGTSGSAHGSPFFQTDMISLNTGDNVVKVTATSADKSVTVSDSIVITYNPTFSFQDRLRANPSVVKAGKSQQIDVNVGIGKASNIVKGSVKIFRVDDAGNTMTSFGAALDDGQAATSGDTIAGDGIYSRKVPCNDANPGFFKIRASVDVSTGGQTYTAYSDVAVVEVVADWNSQEAADSMSALKAAKAAADAAGGGAAGVQAAIDSLKASAVVSDAGPASAQADGSAGFGAWVKFKSGVLGAVTMADGSTRGGGNGPAEETDAALATVQLQSRRVLLLDPFATEFGPDEIVDLGKVAKTAGCPAFSTAKDEDPAKKLADVQTGAGATLNWFRNAYQYGIFGVATHGDAFFKDLAGKEAFDIKHQGSQEVIWTGHVVNPNYFGKTGANPGTCSDTKACGPESECFVNQVGGAGICVDHLTADLRRGRVILGSNGNYGVTDRFFSHHADEAFPHSLAYLGSCRSLWNGTLASELLASGASAVAGYNGYVANDFAIKWGTTFFENLIVQKQLSGVAHVQIEDPAHPGTSFALIGAQNMDASYADVINSSFESGNIEGWLKTGDGRVISQLGQTGAVGGKYMAIISTGLGYTAESGELKQSFCIPAGKTTFSFWWKYYSEEFKEFCGSQYQDEFYCKLVVGSNSKTIMDVRVDDLCDGGKQVKGLTKSDVSFDQGDVWMTPWVHQTADITPLAGGAAVTTRFFATDAGDGIYDTAVLIDKLEFQ